MKIKLLDSSVSNKIAAGEVVERPASIVKELLENSIDAGASAVTVEIKGGGAEFLRISDNGCGMDSEDVKQAFLRHATSKIEKAEDLDNILTLGFRGEALASIAAVSRVNLVTRTPGANEGTEIELEGGEILRFCAAGCPEGTSLRVRDLFFNTPVRRKFLKKASSEAMLVNETVNKMALSNPQLSIRYINDGKTILHTPGDNNLLSAIRAVYGSDFSKNMIAVDYEESGIKVSGFIGTREVQRANRSRQIIFVNGRCVREQTVSAAAQDAYAGRLNIGKFPAFVLNLQMDATIVDVNVHPTKQEVRFAEGLDVYSIVFNAVSGALRKNQEVPDLFDAKKQEDTRKVIEITSFEKPSPAIKSEHREVSASIPEKEVNAAQTNAFSKKSASEVLEFAKFVASSSPQVAQGGFTFEFDKKSADTDYLKQSAPKVQPEQAPKKQAEQATFVAPSASAKQEELEFSLEAQYKLCGTLFDTYIIVQAQDDAYIIDQHAAHERLLFERLFAQCASGQKVEQPLLVPVILDFSPAEILRLEELLPSLEELGFSLEAIGETSFALRAVPALCEDISPKEFVLGLLAENVHSIRSQELKREKLMQLSCKHAIKGGDKLTDAEIKSLMNLIAKENVPLSCPHGRPILIKLSRRELEARFKRIQ